MPFPRPHSCQLERANETPATNSYVDGAATESPAADPFAGPGTKTSRPLRVKNSRRARQSAAPLHDRGGRDARLSGGTTFADAHRRGLRGVAKAPQDRRTRHPDQGAHRGAQSFHRDRPRTLHGGNSARAESKAQTKASLSR